MTEAIYSTTGKINGWGSDRYKTVTNLTKIERQHVMNGGIVIVEYTPTTHNQCGKKLVTYFNGKFGHRELF